MPLSPPVVHVVSILQYHIWTLVILVNSVPKLGHLLSHKFTHPGWLDRVGILLYGTGHLDVCLRVSNPGLWLFVCNFCMHVCECVLVHYVCVCVCIVYVHVCMNVTCVCVHVKSSFCAMFIVNLPLVIHINECLAGCSSLST